jgi:RNA polymerase sigma factor (sigma-70 family)
MALEDVMRDETTELVDVLMDAKGALTALTPKQRQALDLWLQGYTQQEIGERLGCSQSTVSRELRCARDLVRGLCA